MRSTSRCHAVFSFLRRALLPLAFAAALPWASAQPANLQLPAAVQGGAAITALGSHLPDVARAHGLGAQELITLFQTQPSLGVDRNAALFFACEGLAVRADGSLVDGRGRPESNAGRVAEVMAPDSSVTAIANGTDVDAFKLHSLPGVSRIIYLDFNGHTTSGTSWNSSFTGGAPIVSAPFDLDGSPGTFNATERDRIQKIWQRVAEDYAPFGVDVTTEDPGVEALRRTSSDGVHGVRVVISPTNWYDTNAGGVAYLNSFSATTDTPCFAFTQQLANAEKYIAECVSHEAGHTLSLAHDGASGSSATGYYQGHGNWAPIMGVGYYKPLVQFSKGEYTNANNLEDDLAKIANYVPIAGDDHGSTFTGASLLAGPNVATGGTIESRTDADVFRFDAGAGAVSFTIKGPGPDTNLDLKAELFDGNQLLLQTSDSSTSYGATISANIPAGTYFLRLSCVGYGNPASTGYSTYGSIGNYIITGTFPASGANRPPVAVATATTTSGPAPLIVQFSGANSNDPDGNMERYEWNFGNGTTGSGVTANATYTTAGSYSAVLTVFDTGGLTGTATIPVSVSASVNVPPTVSISPTSASGSAPFNVDFTSAASDSDGTIVSREWDFGDGGTATGSTSAAHTYTAPGSYTARLTVMDDRGATASATANITVLESSAIGAGVGVFTLVPVTSNSGTNVQATIVVRDADNTPVAGVTVALQWSGLVSSNTSGTTNSSGSVTLTSPKTKKKGPVTARITTVTLPAGYKYDPALSVSLEQTLQLK